MTHTYIEFRFFSRKVHLLVSSTHEKGTFFWLFIDAPILILYDNALLNAAKYFDPIQSVCGVVFLVFALMLSIIMYETMLLMALHLIFSLSLSFAPVFNHSGESFRLEVLFCFLAFTYFHLLRVMAGLMV